MHLQAAETTYHSIEMETIHRNIFWPGINADHFASATGPEVSRMRSLQALDVGSCQDSAQVGVFTVHFL